MIAPVTAGFIKGQAMATSPGVALRRLPMARERGEGDSRRPCPLLSDAGRCRIYASRPFGCRTFFCDDAEAPFGAKKKLPRDEVNALGRRIADLSSKVAPRDPGPRPLVKALTGRTPGAWRGSNRFKTPA